MDHYSLFATRIKLCRGFPGEGKRVFNFIRQRNSRDLLSDDEPKGRRVFRLRKYKAVLFSRASEVYVASVNEVNTRI